MLIILVTRYARWSKSVVDIVASLVRRIREISHQIHHQIVKTGLFRALRSVDTSKGAIFLSDVLSALTNGEKFEKFVVKLAHNLITGSKYRALYVTKIVSISKPVAVGQIKIPAARTQAVDPTKYLSISSESNAPTMWRDTHM